MIPLSSNYWNWITICCHDQSLFNQISLSQSDHIYRKAANVIELPFVAITCPCLTCTLIDPSTKLWFVWIINPVPFPSLQVLFSLLKRNARQPGVMTQKEPHSMRLLIKKIKKKLKRKPGFCQNGQIFSVPNLASIISYCYFSSSFQWLLF